MAMQRKSEEDTEGIVLLIILMHKYAKLTTESEANSRFSSGYSSSHFDLTLHKQKSPASGRFVRSVSVYVKRNCYTLQCCLGLIC